MGVDARKGVDRRREREAVAGRRQSSVQADGKKYAGGMQTEETTGVLAMLYGREG